MATINATSASQADVEAAIATAVSGDTVLIPAGAVTWGAASNYVQIPAGVIVRGQGDATEITLAVTGTTNSTACVQLQEESVFEEFKILCTSTGLTALSAVGDDWRIGGITYVQSSASPYFIYCGAGRGVIHDCDVTGGNAPAELIFARGATNSWQTASSYGTANNVYVEDCTFGGAGYVCDANDNSRMVIRNCTITGNIKIDGHGYASNSLRGVRHMEVYRNEWTAAAGSWVAVEIRGGGLRAWGNRSQNKSGISVLTPTFVLTDYGATANGWGNFSFRYQTPQDYPIKDQIGVGIDPKAAASEPAYLWDNIAGTVSHAPGIDWTLSWSAPTNITGTTDAAGYATGATAIGVTAWSATARTTDYVKFAGDPNYYRIAAQKSSGAGTLTIEAPGLLQALPAAATSCASGANTLYQQQTGNSSATYTVQDLIAADRDYFKHTAGTTFDGSSGVGIGTRAQMDAITPSKTGVGFWVTNEGSWDTTLSANTSGQLYAWNGSAWVLHYTPYTYPHPLRGALAAPTFLTEPSSQTVTEGETVVMSAVASGNPSPTYQWRKNGTNISGATSATLTITDVGEADEGIYDCVATNSEDSAISASATLTVSPPAAGVPTISSQPASAIRIVSQNATFTVVASGDPSPTYQWRKSGVNISGATGNNHTIPSVTLADIGSYDCVVTNSEGSVTSSAAALTVENVARGSGMIPPSLSSGGGFILGGLL